MNEQTLAKKRLLIKSGLTETKSNTFIVTEAQCLYWWELINSSAFDDTLKPPKKFVIKNFYKDTLGWCQPCGVLKNDHSKRWVNIGIKSTITNKYMFLNILAHEMVHQWEYEILGDWRLNVNHGKNFYLWREPLYNTLGIELKSAYAF